MANYAINGFGRIGRNVLRAMPPEERKKVVVVNNLMENRTLAHLLKYDSSQGKFDADVGYDDNHIIIDGHKIWTTGERDPSKLNHSEHGVDVVLEATGAFVTMEGASKHIEAGAKKVLISAPGKNVDFTMCIGINDSDYDPTKHNVVSNASCTTNCLAPLAKVINDRWGIEKGFMSTIHSYTGDQRLLDASHKDLRRARAAATNIVPTSTGAAKAIGLVIPDLAGKLNGSSFRVPTPTGSLTDFTVVLKSGTTIEEVHAAYKEAAAGELKGILEYSEEPLVLQDIVGNPHSSIYDAGTSLMVGDNFLKVCAWYDNEWGYSCRSADGLKMLGDSL